MPLNKKKEPISSAAFIEKARIWSLLIILQSLLAIAWLLLIPKEPGNAVILGYSLRRLALLLPMALPLIAGLFVKISAEKHAAWLDKAAGPKHLPNTASALVLGGALLAAVVWSFVFLFFFIDFFPDLGAYYRLIPWLASYFLLGLEAALIVPLFIYTNHNFGEPKQKEFPIKTFLIAFLILAAIFILIEAAGLGKDPERFSIITLGVPLLEGQIWYITGLLVLTLIALFAWQSIPKAERIHPKIRKNGDLIIATMLWLTAVILWMSLPLPSHNYFAPEVQPPNFEKYPFSDAEQYDLNALYVYYGSLDDFVVSKPMYVSLLAILHAIGGLSYVNIVLLQTLIVALFPPVLYLIGRELHNRLGGIAIALFAIFREVSSIQATSIANTSNTKLLLSDMPAALLAAVLVLTVVRWFKNRDKKISGHEFLIGGLIGIFILTRIQTMVLAPFALFLVILRYFPKVKSMLLSALIMLTALGLVITPILIRNHSITGVYWVDNPSSSQRLYTKFLDAADYEGTDLIAETREEVLQRNLSVISTAFIKGFGEILQFTGDHFLRNAINAFLVIPVRLGNQTPFLDYLRINQPFWVEVYRPQHDQRPAGPPQFDPDRAWIGCCLQTQPLGGDPHSGFILGL